MISHQPWNRDLPVGAGDSVHDLSPCWDLLPVTDHMIALKTRSYLPCQDTWEAATDASGSNTFQAKLF